MITAITAANVGSYKKLYEEAADILSGYKRVRTYDASLSGNDYFYKNLSATNENELFKVPMKKDADGNDTNEPAITDLTSFASTLAERVILYVKAPEYKNESFSPMLGITTLEEYFHWLKELSLVDRKYTMLPLDEPHFVINANTRAINIPDEFKKNGIAV